MYIQDDESRQSYLYDYYLQLTVCVVNAKTLKRMLSDGSSKKRRRHKRAVASVFFRFSHRDRDGNFIKNKEQLHLIEIMKQDIEGKMKSINSDKKIPVIENFEESKKADISAYQSTTYIPYYDKIPKDSHEKLEDDEFELINDDDSFPVSPSPFRRPKGSEGIE